MLFTTPLLDKPAPGWKHDLPGPNESPSNEPYPPVLSNPPNHVDDVYLELARATVRTRGIGIWIAPFMFLLSMVTPAGMISYVVTEQHLPPLVLSLLGPIVFITGIWLGIYIWRMDVAPPRDEPIRFNRFRRKVYVYRFYRDGLRPFSRTAWGVRIEVYDWDNLRAEACSVYGPMGSGGLIETVTLAVVKPGTHQVIDRFHFAHEIQQGEMYWAMAQLFMQQGPQALPAFPRPPRDWNNEDVTFNLARRWAPKVRWPAELDLESRTAP
ncbi:DUF6708 domain-containing protein [Pseudomonas synxantha]|uniref:DUF6708 domain-containing protein n=1 Tax=Pseudomonas synxantha TaxID=47883 RepID=UPI002E7FC83E|nr:DUF6708 domain-containing protein [Pseudomonas synxantha]